jgi:hypothetical protein
MAPGPGAFRSRPSATHGLVGWSARPSGSLNENAWYSPSCSATGLRPRSTNAAFTASVFHGSMPHANPSNLARARVAPGLASVSAAGAGASSPPVKMTSPQLSPISSTARVLVLRPSPINARRERGGLLVVGAPIEADRARRSSTPLAQRLPLLGLRSLAGTIIGRPADGLTNCGEDLARARACGKTSRRGAVVATRSVQLLKSRRFSGTA